MTITLDIVREAIAEEVPDVVLAAFKHDETLPCHIDAVWRLAVCGQSIEHPADWEVLLSCGCAFAHCDWAFTWFRHGGQCAEDEHLPTHIVTAGKIR